MSRRLAMARLATAMAESPLFGYSNKPPNGRWGPDFDCSSFIYFVAWLAGYSVGIGSGKVRFTGQMTKDFKDAGFEILPFANVGLGDLQIGDILLNLALHAEIYVGEGQVVGAQAAEDGTFSGEAGDQSGTEIVKQPAYVFEKDWDYVLRPPVDEDEEEATEAKEEGDEQDMAYPYANTTMGNGNWMPQNTAPGYSRATMPANGWMPPMQNYGMNGYPQGNVGQMNGYSVANAGYQQPMQNYPQGSSRQLTHVKDLNEVRDIHVGPGEAIAVFIGEGEYMAIKSADQEGFPSTRVFRMEECTEGMAQHRWMPGMGQEQEGGYSQEGQYRQQPQMQQTQGVSRQEFDQLKEMIANVQSAISTSGFPQGNGSAGSMDAQANAGNAQSSGSKQSGNRGNGRNS